MKYVKFWGRVITKSESVTPQGVTDYLPTHLCIRSADFALWLHRACLKGSFQVLVQSHPEGDTEGTEKAGERRHPMKVQTRACTIPLLPIHLEEKPEALPWPGRLSNSSGLYPQLTDLRSCSPSSLTGSKHSPQGLCTCWPSARKNLPDSCTAHPACYLGLCSNITIQEPSLTFQKSSPSPTPLAISLT